MGNKKFNKLRDFLTLPSTRTLRTMKSKMPINGSGFRPEVFESLKDRFDSVAKGPEDYDIILAWDATGYNQSLRYDKSSGRLLGFNDDPERFTMHNKFEKTVNCFMVTSPQRHLGKIKFPVAYYHGATLNAADIRRQVQEVLRGLDNVGFRVVCVVCDGASEHHKYFDMSLDGYASLDNTIKIRKDSMWAISDCPHLVKKFRNNWLSSGFKSRHTRLMSKDGFHIAWTLMQAIYTVSTTLPNGCQRSLTILPKVSWDVIEPTHIQRLRVSLAALPFSKGVRDFVSQNLGRLVGESRLREGDVRLTLEYMGVVDELFQIMNSRYPITWTDKDDGTGAPIGLRDLVDTSKGHSLSFFSKIFGVSVQYLIDITGLTSAHDVPPPDMMILIDRPSRLLKIAKYFSEWNESLNAMPDLTQTQRSKLFITHWLFKDLRRTCYSMVEMMKNYIPGTSRCWVPRRFNQDPIESAFGQVRNMSGSDVNMNRTAVETGFSELRATQLKTVT